MNWILLLHFLAFQNLDTNTIGQKIWFNECSGSVDKLIFWNPHEDCISLGIGHFIWYPKNVPHKFEAMFPLYIAYLKSKSITIPKIAESSYAPWQTREEFLSDKKAIDELKKWLSETIVFQTEFIINRLSYSIDEIIKSAATDERKTIAQSIKDLQSSTEGSFAMIDYLNFKGSGLFPNERYKGKGWGLYQVLLGMEQTGGITPLEKFKISAIRVLTERVQNAPPEKNENRWLAGWENRILRY